MKATKPSQELKVYVDLNTYKKFKKKVAEHDFTMSQWIRNKIMNWVKD